MNPVLIEMVTRCGEWLKAECIRRVGTAHAFCERLDSQRWYQPPMRPQASINGIDLGHAVRLLYSPDSVRVSDVVDAWGTVVPLINARKAAARDVMNIMAYVFPRVPFTTHGGLDMRTCLVQFLTAASWHHGTFRLSGSEAVLTLPNRTTLGLYKNAIEWCGGYRRTRPLPFRPVTIAAKYLSGHRASLMGTGAIYRLLVGALPELTKSIHALFAIATWAGRVAEGELVQIFDVQRRAEGDVDTTEQIASILQLQQLIRNY